MRDRQGQRFFYQTVSEWSPVRGALAACVVLSIASGCSPTTNLQLTGEMLGYRSDVSTIQMVSTLLGGKNVFVPSTVVVSDAKPQTLSIFNTTENPHGFTIAGLGIQVVLPAQEEIQIELPSLTGGQIHQINCHLHPPHRSATLVVVRGE